MLRRDILACLGLAALTTTQAVTIYLNAGGGSYSDNAGRVWVPDDAYVSTGNTHVTNSPIAATENDQMYQSERWFNSVVPYEYTIPIPAPGSYVVKLHFAEIYFTSSGQRVFDIYVEESLVVAGYDIFQQAGGRNAAVIATVIRNITDGALNIRLSKITENPKISGIEVFAYTENLAPVASPTSPPVLAVAPPPTIFPAVRINAGGDPYIDAQGFGWEADEYFSTGATFSSSECINQGLESYYCSERYFNKWVHNTPYEYKIPVGSAGTYKVTLHFCEIYFSQVGQREFQVWIEDMLVEVGLDIVKEAGGKNKPLVLTYYPAVTDGFVSIEFVSLIDNPKISAIEVAVYSISPPTPITPPTAPIPTATIPTATIPTATIPTAPIPTAPTPVTGITGFQLIYVPNNTEVMDLANGSIVNAALFPEVKFNIKAVNVGTTVQSVRFLPNGQNEGTQPFAYCSDTGGVYKVCAELVPGPNDITVTVTPFTGPYQSGTALPNVSVTFKITGSSAPTVPTPTAPAPTAPTAPTPTAPTPTAPTAVVGQWIQTDANASINARHEASFVLVDNPTIGRRAYLIGGRGNKDTDTYNPVTRTWSKGAKPPLQLHHMQTVAAQGKLWIMAGWTWWFPQERNTEYIYVYDPVTNTWQNKTALSLARRRGSAAVVVSDDQTKIYVSHGNTGGHEQANFSTSLGYLDVYDIATDSWTALPDAPNPRDHTGGAMINGRICVAGGRNGGEINWPEVAPTDCYNITAGQWKVEAPIPQVRGGSSYGTSCDGKLMVAGGEGSGKAWDRVDVFDGTSWTTIDNLVIGRHGSGLAVDCVCNQIYIASGAAAQGGGPEITSVETYFPGGVDVPCSA